MRAGSLKHRVRIEERVRTPDEGGGTVEGWVTKAEGLRARILEMAGSEKVVADKLSGVLTHELTLRRSSKTEGLSNLMRIVEVATGRIHDVKTVKLDERRRDYVVTTQTGGRVD